MLDFAFYQEERLWDGIDKEINRWLTHKTELRRSSVVVDYTRTGDPEQIVLPKMSMDQVKGMAFLARYLYENHPDLSVFALGVLEAIKLHVFEKFQVKERVIEDSIEWFLLDLQHFYTFSEEPHWKHFITNHFGNYATEGPKNQGIFFGNWLKPAFLLIERISLKGEAKVKKPQRRKGYNDKGSTRPQSKWKPNEDFSFDDDQRYSYLMRDNVVSAYNLSLGYVYSDRTDFVRSEGRSIDSLLSELNYKNPKREDDLYVTRNPKYSKPRRKPIGKTDFSPQYREGELTEPYEQEGTVRDTDFTDRIKNKKLGSTDLRNLKKTVEERAIVTVHEYNGSGPYSERIEELWKQKYKIN